MVKLAVLDPALPHQISERPQDLDGIEVVWSGTSLEDLRRAVKRHQPTVIAVDLDSLGPEPAARIRELEASSNGLELVITLYRFARRAVVDELSGERRKAVKSPISLGGLRSQMLGVVVRSILSPPAAVNEAVAERSRTIAQRTFSAAQLGRLVEIQSGVQCECPNHLSSLLLSLTSFEDYSAACLNEDDDDAAMHRLLYEQTAKAREVMERALEALLRHEKIVL